MEYLEGGQVNDLAYIRSNKINPYEVADKLSRLYSQMIFIHGFVHSDPHPGNILVKKTSEGEIDIIYISLQNLFICLRNCKNIVILSDSKAALQAIISTSSLKMEKK